MIQGNGDIASVLPDRDDLLFFASGVSNSQETRESEYIREIKLLMKQPLDKRLVYFSSLSIFYSNTRYTKHKVLMEEFVKTNFPLYTIVRLGNIDWGKNPHTIINHFKNQIKEGQPLEIRDEARYIVSKAEFLHWIDLIPSWSVEMNVPGRLMMVKDIVEEIKNGHLK